MGTARLVPQTYSMPGEELSVDDAWQALRRYGGWHLVRDSYVRFRYGDGFSHARALALQICLAVIPAVIALVGLSALLGQDQIGQVLERTLHRMTPGASQPLVREAVSISHRQAEHGVLALWIGLVAAVVSVTTAMGQVERGANRIYGIERDRPFPAKYGFASLMAMTAGVPISLGFVILVAGRQVGQSLAEVYHWQEDAVTLWSLLRWPAGLVMALLAASVLFRHSPRRRQPGHTWLAVGAAVSLIFWLLFTWLLVLYVESSSAFGGSYGPLTAVIALLVWANLTSIALFLGLAFAAQLEARRAGQDRPVLPDPGSGPAWDSSGGRKRRDRSAVPA